MRLAIAALALIASISLPSEALAAFPGDNGKLAVVDVSPLACTGTCERDIYTVNPDGTGKINVTNHVGLESDPMWSPDGTKLAFGAGYGGQSDIWVVNADGTGLAPLTSDTPNQFEPAWSPDGQRIAFTSTRDGNYEVYVMDADGTDQTRLTNDPAYDAEPAWSPDGQRIAFVHDSGIRFMNPDGSGSADFPFAPGCFISQVEYSPDWAPTNDEIAFVFGYDTDCEFEADPAAHVGTARPDGRPISQHATSGCCEPFSPVFSPDRKNIAYTVEGGVYVVPLPGTGGTFHFVTRGDDPDWQPRLRGYVRPQGATPVHVPLVPAAKQCTSPNTTHGGPLASSSCTPALPEATAAFLGIGDGDPAPARSIGHVLLKAGTADVSINTRLTHVMNTSDHADYTGELRLELPLRVTDRFNRPHPSTWGPGTVADTSFFATVPCAATPAEPNTGSTCALNTTANALLPGTVRAGARAVWGLGQVRLHDGGPDGDADTAGDNSLLAVQGVFVP